MYILKETRNQKYKIQQISAVNNIFSIFSLYIKSNYNKIIVRTDT